MKQWSCPCSWAIRASVRTWPKAGTGWEWPESGATSSLFRAGLRQDPAGRPAGTLREQLLQELEPDRTRQRILKNQLLKIRQDGYCISEGEVDQGVAAIAIPLRLKDNIFVLSISGPVDRLRALTYPVLRQGLAETVTRLERKSMLVEE